MTDSNQHSEFVSAQSFQVIRECLAQGQRAMDELGWTQRDVMVMATLRRIEEQLETLREGLHEIIREFTKGRPRDYEGPDTYEEDDPVVIIARRLLGDSNPASSPCDHTWSLPENAGVFRCMKCGAETTDVEALNPAISRDEDPELTVALEHVAAENRRDLESGYDPMADDRAHRAVDGSYDPPESTPASEPKEDAP